MRPNAWKHLPLPQTWLSEHRVSEVSLSGERSLGADDLPYLQEGSFSACPWNPGQSSPRSNKSFSMSVAPPDTNEAPKYVISCAILAALALSLCVARIWTRAFPLSRLTLDDYLIVIAEVSGETSYFQYVMILISLVGSVSCWLLRCRSSSHSWLGSLESLCLPQEPSHCVQMFVRCSVALDYRPCTDSNIDCLFSSSI